MVRPRTEIFIAVLESDQHTISIGLASTCRDDSSKFIFTSLDARQLAPATKSIIYESNIDECDSQIRSLLATKL
jgi:hypothetical protein